MADDSINLESALTQAAGTPVSVKALNPDGTVTFTATHPVTNQPVTKSVQVAKLLEAFGKDPAKTDVTYNSPDSASDSGNLSFGTRFKMALGGDPKSQENALKDQYGQDNVAQRADGSLVVKEAGVWKKADSSWADTIGAMIDPAGASDAEINAASAKGSELGASMLAGIGPGVGYAVGTKAGVALGARAGKVLGPGGIVVGGVLGGWLGGAAGGALAKVIQDEGAHAAGIKSEYDAKQAADTFGQEMALNLAVSAALGPVAAAVKGDLGTYARAGLKATREAGAAAQAVLTGGISGESANVASQWLEKRSAVPGSQKAWETIMKSPESAQNVVGDLRAIDEHYSLPPDQRPAASPVQQEIVQVGDTAMKGAKASAMNNYRAKMASVESVIDTDKPTVSGANSLTKFKTALAKLGVLEQDENGTFQVAKNLDETGQRIMQVFSKGDLNALNTVLRQASSVITPVEVGEAGATRAVERKISYNQAQGLMSGVDSILENSGYYNQGDNAVSSQARRALTALRADLKNDLTSGVKEQHAGAGKIMEDAGAEYHRFRSLYNDFAMPSKLDGTDQTAYNSLTKMMSGSRDLQKSDFEEMLGAAGVNAKPIVSRLEQLNAADMLSDVYTSKGFSGAIKNMAGQNPRDLAEALARQTERRGAGMLMQAVPVSQNSIKTVDAYVASRDFLDKLSMKDKFNLMSNPELANAFFKTMDIGQ